MDESVSFINFPQIVQEQALITSRCSVPGNEAFMDHVHPTIEMHRQLGRELVQSLAELDLLNQGDTSEQIVAQTTEEILGSLDQTQHAVALSNLSQVLAWAGKDKEALQLAKKAEQQDAKNVDVLCQLGRMYEKTGQVENAQEVLERAVEAGPENPLALFRFARIHMRRQEWEKSHSLLLRALEVTTTMEPRAFRIGLLESLSFSSSQLGDHKKAAEYQKLAQKQ